MDAVANARIQVVQGGLDVAPANLRSIHLVVNAGEFDQAVRMAHWDAG